MATVAEWEFIYGQELTITPMYNGERSKAFNTARILVRKNEVIYRLEGGSVLVDQTRLRLDGECALKGHGVMYLSNNSLVETFNNPRNGK